MISTETSAQLRRMLEGVLEPGGTASSVERAGLRARRQDRHRAEGRGRHLLRAPLRRLVRRLRSRPEPEAAGCRGRRRADSTSTPAARWRRPSSATSPRSRCPTWGSRRDKPLVQGATPRIARDEARGAPARLRRRRRSARRRRRGDLRSRLRQPPVSRPGTLFFCVTRAEAATGTSSPPRRSRRAPPPSWSSGRWTSACPRSRSPTPGRRWRRSPRRSTVTQPRS